LSVSQSDPWFIKICDEMGQQALLQNNDKCLLSANLFWCRVDNLFGNCQNLSHVDGEFVDNYRYSLTGAQLSELYHIVLRLVADGYSWHHRRTQCILFETLSWYRHSVSVIGHIPMICDDIQLLEGHFQPNVVNSSQSVTQEMSPNVRSGFSGNHDKAFGKFAKLMQSIQADDLLALKHFLLGGSTYKRPTSVKTGPVAPSLMPTTEGEWFWIRNWSHIATHLLVVLVGASSLKSLRLRCFKLGRDGI